MFDEELVKKIEERLNDLISADDECRKGALAKRDWEGVRYFQTGMFFTERAKDAVLEVLNVCRNSEVSND